MNSKNYQIHSNILQAYLLNAQQQYFEEETQPLEENINSSQHFFDYTQKIKTIDKFLRNVQKLKQMPFYKN